MSANKLEKDVNKRSIMFGNDGRLPLRYGFVCSVAALLFSFVDDWDLCQFGLSFDV